MVVLKDQILQGSNVETTDFFGARIQMASDGNTMVISAKGDDGPSNTVSSVGSAYIYKYNFTTGIFYEYQQLYPTSISQQTFGQDADISADGSIVTIGASTFAGGFGGVYVFRHNTTTGMYEEIQKQNGQGSGDNLGYTVAISDNSETVAGGAPYNDGGADGSTGNAGVAYIWQYNPESGYYGF